MRRSRAFLLGLTLLLAAGPARAAGGVHLTWGDCALQGAGQPVQAFACDTDLGSEVLYCGLVMPAPTDSVLGLELTVDIQHSAPVLPDWWRFNVAGCRSGSLGADTDFGQVSTCQEMWQAPAAGGVLSYVVGMPRGGANQAGVLIGFSLPSGQLRTLDATSMYYAARILIANDGTTTGCGGCEDAACLVLNSIRVLRPPRPDGVPSGDVVVTTPGAGSGNWASWQAATANCAAVPVRNMTWGAVKSLYR